MRAEAAGNILRIVFFGLTGLSTALFTLRAYGYGEYARYFTALLVGGTVVFMYLYAERGVYNQKNRDTADVGDNYSGPTMLMDARIEARQLAYLGYAIQNGGKSLAELEEEMQAVTEQEWADLREGIDVGEIERRKRREAKR
jgi:hypothetical protein